MPRNQPLNGQQKKFIKAYVSSGDAVYAASRAGYSQPGAQGYQQLAKPRVEQEIRRQQARRLDNDILPLAVDFVEKVLTDEKETTRNKLAAADKVFKYTLGRDEAGAGMKDPHEMTADEIGAELARLRSMQAEIAGRAKDVTPVSESDAQEPGSDTFG